ncbi:MAG: pyruvate dehydrogenase (acetyl-transferring) E1 component subunit alpha, partial [Gammaproteobacteria bacterium]|nr:pyruvate dehydrogenase (acetyl-transferring) E1 component subunit alpha [Gammaproteobacteria bacterium]
GGFEGIQVDGNDVIAVREVMENALAKARSGKGPTLVEALTYRISDHTTADDATRYRGKEEVEEAKKKEPLIRIRKYLTSIGAWDQKKEDKLLAECAAQIDAEVKLYKDTGKPPLGSMFDHMFANLPESLVEQRAAALAEGDHHG